jgi:hypothetical protein
MNCRIHAVQRHRNKLSPECPSSWFKKPTSGSEPQTRADAHSSSSAAKSCRVDSLAEQVSGVFAKPWGAWCNALMNAVSFPDRLTVLADNLHIFAA